MSVTRDIFRSYVRPRLVAERRIEGDDEPLALGYLISACIILFVATLPGLQRSAHLAPENGNLASLAYGSFLGAVLLAPIVLYALSALLWLILRLAGTGLSGVRVRLALFWALLVTTPLMLLRGLTEGLVGAGMQLQLMNLMAGLGFLFFTTVAIGVARGLAPRDANR
ncbi:YIP1 family protein [Pseudohalocynthiibacter aestuariivivens]|jgi:hypothetical protein|uniref:YIP1 family protein n=1 Tax=Pseudohalocynthiibacter aestuariivivens TaxID=1591409 RepID=A0ABV5JGE1_9RHOB|nr:MULTISPECIES: YIP1 family protein [Pseudohalocynthiibacter]MBS9716127.1 YIP1 family protein [Pseudohalocynthiibacter aestuariivivens]MCK0101065.1 YIP1 family protein [Pseudohalocynthiibacter sp. F2068]